MENKPQWLLDMESKGYWEKKECNYIWYCCAKMKEAKTGADVYRIMTIWTNHVNPKHDWLIKRCIPEELK